MTRRRLSLVAREPARPSSLGLTFVKLGGSVITDKTVADTLRGDNLTRLAAEIQSALAQATAEGRNLAVLLGHGGGSFAHFPASQYKTRLGLQAGLPEAEAWRGYAETHAAAARLNQHVTAACLAAGLTAVAYQPSASAVARDGQLFYLETDPLRTLLHANGVPIIYGDAILDDVRGFTIASTEQLFVYLARGDDLTLRPRRIILVGELGGVFTADPLHQPAARPIPLINAANLDRVRGMLGGSHGVDVTGGMLTKIVEMYALVQAVDSLQVQLIDGTTPGLLHRALLGEAVAGTVISRLGVRITFLHIQPGRTTVRPYRHLRCKYVTHPLIGSSFI